MNKNTRLATAVALTAVLATAVSWPLWGSEVPTAAVDACVADLLAISATPGAQVAVVMDGELVYQQGYGTTQRSNGRPVGASARGRRTDILRPAPSTLLPSAPLGADRAGPSTLLRASSGRAWHVSRVIASAHPTSASTWPLMFSP